MEISSFRSGTNLKSTLSCLNMSFLDEAYITVKSGDGGKGCVSFRREKFIPKGGPNGGDGGNGGSVIVHATSKLHCLMEYSSQKYRKAGNGKPGQGKNKSGKNGEDLILKVPLGTIIQDRDTDEIMADLIHDNQQITILQGGKGGKGNQHFATSRNRTPRIAQPGIPSEQKRLKLSLSFLADIGIIGFPNAGKSTLLSSLSNAKPKINSYPFTTIVPNLGIMVFPNEGTLILADIPGLIEGASLGRGLGHQFLKHIERTKLLLIVLDITYLPKHDLLEDYKILRHEMDNFNHSLINRPHKVVFNKMDLYNSGLREIDDLKNQFNKLGIKPLFISALTGEGIDTLKKELLPVAQTDIN